MYTKILTLFVILRCLYGIEAQICVPDPVDYVLFEGSTVSWRSSQNCPNTIYELRIATGGTVTYSYRLEENSMDVSFLPLCKHYSFTVRPIAQAVTGIESDPITGGLELPADANIVVKNLTGFLLERDVLIEWYIDEIYTYCVSFFQVIRWDEDDTATSLFTSETGVLLQNVARCTKYRFVITPYMTSYGDSAEFNYTVPDTFNEPTLIAVEQDVLSINTTWSLEKYSINRCEVTALLVNSTRFNETISIQDSPERPDVKVSITGLRANSMYYFEVSTVNSAGTSRPFRMSVQTLPISFTDE